MATMPGGTPHRTVSPTSERVGWGDVVSRAALDVRHGGPGQQGQTAPAGAEKRPEPHARR